MLLLSAFTIVLPALSMFMMSLATVYLIVTEEARMGLSVEPSCMKIFRTRSRYNRLNRRLLVRGDKKSPGRQVNAYDALTAATSFVNDSLASPNNKIVL